MYTIDYLFWTYCLEHDLEADVLIEKYGLINVFRDWIINNRFTLPLMSDDEIKIIIENTKKEDEKNK